MLYLGRNAGRLHAVIETTREEVVGAITSGVGLAGGRGRRRRRRRRTSGVSTTTSARDPRLEVDGEGISGLWTRFTRRAREGELGSLPVVVGLIVIWVFFSFKEENFLTAGNITNLMLQMTGFGIIATASCWCSCSARSTCRSASSAVWRPPSWPC